jgi:hypothetical protein
MDTKTKIFWWTMGILILASFGATFYRYMIKKDYIVQAQVDCDPYGEACFVWNCDPVSEIEGEVCTGDPEADTWYYKIINKNASKIQICDANDEECDALVCAQDEPDCEFVFCNPENKDENYSEICIDPAEYALENPIEEDSCSEDDLECADVDDEDVVTSEEDHLLTSEEEAMAEDISNDSTQEGDLTDGEEIKEEQTPNELNSELNQESEVKNDESGNLPIE